MVFMPRVRAAASKLGFEVLRSGRFRLIASLAVQKAIPHSSYILNWRSFVLFEFHLMLAIEHIAEDLSSCSPNF